MLGSYICRKAVGFHKRLDISDDEACSRGNVEASLPCSQNSNIGFYLELLEISFNLYISFT
jgi:hypothetical protein